MMLSLKSSRGGAIAAGLFVFAAVAVFTWIFFIASKNPADSGESGILLAFFAMPWISLLPSAWLGLMTAFACIALNAFILYCVFGGLRLSTHKNQLGRSL